MKKLWFILAMVVLGGALAPTAQASSIQFDLTPGSGPGSGTISYITAQGPPIFGIDLLVSTITGQGTPDNSGEPFMQAGPPIKVAFETGAFTNSDASHWYFAGGGAISAFFTPEGSLTTDLVTGTFQDPSLSSFDDGTSHEFLGTFTASLDPSLALFYGFQQGPPIFQGELRILATTTNGISPPGQIVTYAIVSGSLTLTPVPVPGSAWLLLSGLAGLTGLRRFRKS